MNRICPGFIGSTFRYLALLTGALCVLSIHSCKKDIERLDDLEVEDWTPIFAAPLIDTHFTVQDLLDADDSLSALVEVNNDGLLALRYSGDLATLNLETILDIDDQAAEGSVEIDEGDAALIESGIDVSLPLEYVFPLNVDPYDIEVDEVKLSGGFLNIVSVFDTGEDISGLLTIPQMLDASGVAFELLVDQSNPNQNIDLTGYSLMPGHPAPYNNEIEFTATINVTNNPGYTSQAGDAVSVEIEMVDLAFEYVLGDFGNLSVVLDQDSISLDVLGDAVQAENFLLQEAEIEIQVTNSFGFPVELEFPDAFSENLQTGAITPLAFTETFELQGQQTLEGTPEETTMVIDESNSNLLDILQPTPQMLVFNAIATANPNGPPPASNPNFIRSDSQMDLGVDVYLPLSMQIEALQLADTVEAEIEVGEVSFVDSLEFRIETNNGFPVDAALQLVFLDSNYVAIDSLYTGLLPLLNAAPVNTEGFSVGVSNSVNYITINRTRYEQLESMKHMAVRGILSTSSAAEGQYSVIDEQSGLGLKVGTKIYGHEEL